MVSYKFLKKRLKPSTMGFAHNPCIRRLKGKRIRVEGQCVLVTPSNKSRLKPLSSSAQETGLGH